MELRQTVMQVLCINFICFSLLIGYFIFKKPGTQTCGEPKTVQKNYSDQMELAYDPVFSWLSAKDVKVNLTVVLEDKFFIEN